LILAAFPPWLYFSDIMHSLYSLLLWAALARASSNRIQPRQNYEFSGTCKENSFSHPVWYFWDPTVVQLNASRGGSVGDFGVSVYNTALDQNFDCYGQDINLAPGVDGDDEDDEIGWFDCTIPGAQIKPNMKASTLSIRQTWTCSDDPR
jgi:hypothetical protein